MAGRATCFRSSCAAILAISAASNVAVRGDEADRVSKFDIPLKDGRVELGELSRRLAEELKLDWPSKLGELDWSFDVSGFFGSQQLKAIERLADGAVAFQVQPDRLTVMIDQSVVQRQMIAAEQKARQWMQSPATSAAPDVFGLKYLNGSPAADPASAPEHAVILVHGLDDPGMMWNDLIPELLSEGFQVGVFRYPNDGPVAESADLLARTLEDEHRKGLKRVDVVAHSMGGLVVRDMLTRSAHYAGNGSGGGRFPSVDRFIMIGTPNHGAKLARFRFFTQAGEQISRVVNGHPMAAAEPGSGEAAIDLLPNSDFLRRLNSRPLASHTRYTNITSQWLSFDVDRVQQHLDRARGFAQEWAGDAQWGQWVAQFNSRNAVQKMVEASGSLGDGCVSIESARLDGIDDFVVLEGNHVSVLWNGPFSDARPPVVPVVLDRLHAPLPPSE